MYVHTINFYIYRNYIVLLKYKLLLLLLKFMSFENILLVVDTYSVGY